MKDPAVFELRRALFDDDDLFNNSNNSALSKDSQVYRDTAYVFMAALKKVENEDSDKLNDEAEIRLKICTMEDNVLLLEDGTSDSEEEMVREVEVSSSFPSRHCKLKSVENFKSMQSTSESNAEWSREKQIVERNISLQLSDDGVDVCGKDISGRLRSQRAEGSKTSVRSAISLITANIGSRLLNFFLRKKESNV
ncbi:hypothetical protein CHS0354_014126 [Potamilus streckersoni]|uniref:Uncharacterized protein n=1 Tax=Potamilus streckersoni TaxID=2493646 RepID=A0AAE0WGI0_9BIVA|nr:hypothetical protein CHS0354_014126 [Potamilus streckersoni]